MNPHPPGPYHVRAKDMGCRKPGALSIELHRYWLAGGLDLEAAPTFDLPFSRRGSRELGR